MPLAGLDRPGFNRVFGGGYEDKMPLFRLHDGSLRDQENAAAVACQQPHADELSRQKMRVRIIKCRPQLECAKFSNLILQPLIRSFLDFLRFQNIEEDTKNIHLNKCILERLFYT